MAPGKAGEDATFHSTLVGGALRGEEADIKVTVTKVSEQELPKVDEEFAQLVSQFDTVEEMNSGWLREVGEAFEATGAVTIGKVGSAEARLFSQRAAVDFALGWLESKHAEARASR